MCLQEGKKASASSEGCGVLSVSDGLVLLDHCLETSGSGKSVSAHPLVALYVRAVVFVCVYACVCVCVCVCMCTLVYVCVAMHIMSASAASMAAALHTHPHPPTQTPTRTHALTPAHAPTPTPTHPPTPGPTHTPTQDLRDALLGRVFGLGALVRAGLVRTASAAAMVATALFVVARKKTFLREAAACVVLEMLLGGPEGGPAGVAAGGACARVSVCVSACACLCAHVCMTAPVRWCMVSVLLHAGPKPVQKALKAAAAV